MTPNNKVPLDQIPRTTCACCENPMPDLDCDGNCDSCAHETPTPQNTPTHVCPPDPYHCLTCSPIYVLDPVNLLQSVMFEFERLRDQDPVNYIQQVMTPSFTELWDDILIYLRQNS